MTAGLVQAVALQLSLLCVAQIQFVVMAMEMQLFSKGNWSIGRPIITEESPWFKGSEVAKSLDYANPRNVATSRVQGGLHTIRG